MTSIILTIHNKAFLLPDVLAGIKNNAIGNYEIIFVLDGCTDSSPQMVEYFCTNNPRIKTTVIDAPNVFETKANNLALRASTGSHIIIVQDDQIITEAGWNQKLLKPFFQFEDVFAVTARCAHSWRVNEQSVDLHSSSFDGNRWADILHHTNHADKSNISRDTFAVRDTVNRGPLAINRADLEAMGYLDEIYEPQGFDEHDLMYRMKSKLGKVCGFYNIDWYSKPEYGGTRNEDGSTKKWMLEADWKNSKIFYERHKNAMLLPAITENRIIK